MIDPIPRRAGLACACVALGWAAAAAAPKARTGTRPQAAAATTIDLPPPPPQAAFDSVQIHKLYLDGDFDEAIAALEGAIRRKPAFTHQDSVFFCKHLGVMYAATYETREKGKYYMHMLLTVEPTAKILDMYASDMIYMIFKNIQDEFEESRMRLARAEEHVRGNAQGDSAASRRNASMPDPKVSRPHPWFWVGAGAALVAAGAVTYLALEDKPGTRHADYAFPNP